MKKYTLLSVFLLTFVSGYAQLTKSDLKSGKHIHSTIYRNINGAWFCKNAQNSFEVKIKTDVKHYQTDDLNITFDNLIISVTKFIFDGQDISDKFKTPMELLVSANSGKEFRGNYQDPVTKNHVIISFKQISDKSFDLTITFPEMNVFNDLSKGTVLPKFSVFSR